jgi:hypothetical protein
MVDRLDMVENVATAIVLLIGQILMAALMAVMVAAVEVITTHQLQIPRVVVP